MIICFATDLHGRVNLFEQLIDVAYCNHADLIVFGGDMLPDGEMGNPCAAQVQFVTQYLAEWIRRLAECRPACRLATVFGNHDWLCSALAIQSLETQALLTVLRPDRPARFGDWHVLGYSYSPPSPFWSRDFERLDRRNDTPPLADGARWDPATESVVKAASDYYASLPTIEEDLSRIPEMTGPWIFVAHAPPYGVGLDLLITGEAVGSHSIRQFIARRQPPISLHGHLHDSPQKSGVITARIGRTVAINPGQGTEILAAITFDPDDVIGTLTAHGIRLPRSP